MMSGGGVLMITTWVGNGVRVGGTLVGVGVGVDTSHQHDFGFPGGAFLQSELNTHL